MEIERFQSAMTVLLGAQDAEDLERRIVDVLPGTVGFERVAVLSMPTMQHGSRVRCALGNPHLDLSAIPVTSPLAPGGSMDGHRIGSQNDAERPHGNVRGSYVLAPLRERGRNVSMVYADSLRAEIALEKAAAAVAHVLETASVVRANLTLALERQRLLNELETLSRTDALTSLPNRRAFEERLEIELHRSARTRRPFGLAVFDLDHYKAITETYGGPAADEALRQFAEILRGRARHIDLAARFEGDRFALLVLEADQKAARVIVERVLDAARQARLSVPAQLSASAGVALSYPVDTPQTLLDRADAALSEAKQNGRNRAKVT